jgi:hypothetical protein
MLRAEEYRRYAAECWRRGWEDPQLREHWLTMAARWMALAYMAAKAESQSKSKRYRSPSQISEPSRPPRAPVHPPGAE